MGWLRDLMDQSDSGCRSYGDLARAALENGDWPAESRMAERSLASIFSKLDRNLEADWLAERVGVQRVLSKVLGGPARRGAPSRCAGQWCRARGPPPPSPELPALRASFGFSGRTTLPRAAHPDPQTWRL